MDNAKAGLRSVAVASVAPRREARRLGVELSWAIPIVLCGSGLEAMTVQSILADQAFSDHFISPPLRRSIVRLLGGKLIANETGLVADIDYLAIFAIVLGFSLLFWIGGAAWLKRRGLGWQDALGRWGTWGWLWVVAGGSWDAIRLTANGLALTDIDQVVESTPAMWQSSLLAGWGATFVTLLASATQTGSDAAPAPEKRGSFVPLSVWMGIGAYFICFGAMNWLLWAGLLIPHGDSAMYEEHLWNLLHGKGFRSYIDQGLFLGEHIQVIHLGLIPLYLLWPSHVLLELCESLGLALGAIPIFFMARRHTESTHAAVLLSLSYLLYFPMQRLDIAIDFKTFRPEAFGIPLLLCAFEALDRRAYKSMLVWLGVTLLVKEDYALVLIPLGIWIACCGAAPADSEPQSRSRIRWLGGFIALFGCVYLALAVKVVIPYFKSGDAVHYTRYFSKFGASPNEVIYNLLTQPGLVVSELCTAENAIFALALLLPLGFVPLLSPSRVAVGLPLFGALCLNEIARNPQHHFHAPLVAILYWAGAAGLGHVDSLFARLRRRSAPAPGIESGAMGFVSRWACASALTSGFFFSLSPLGIAFWDPDSGGSWQKKYVPGKRAAMFPRVLEEITPDHRVASTDFVHPRFTHYDRSYDYSGYRPIVPEDADFIVIDVLGPYSEIRSPKDVKEYRNHPEQWELIEDRTEGLFIILKRRRG